jgi:hypothetical protein
MGGCLTGWEGPFNAVELGILEPTPPNVYPEDIQRGYS